MEYLADYALFVAKLATVLAAIAILVGMIAAGIARARGGPEPRIEVRHLNRRYQAMRARLERAMRSRRDFRRLLKTLKRERRQAAGEQRRRVFVIDFHGDIRAGAVASLREEVTAVLEVARPEDEVVVRIESPGGVVHGYGLAASQLGRIRSRGIPLTVAVDKVAASGGYLMACVADRILAAPFAVVGSIGVVAQLPNFHRWLAEHHVDWELHTAGEYKRTLTLFGENTEEGRRKFREELEQAHALFKAFLGEHRPALDLERVATGEHWYGRQAVALGLVDDIVTSDDYLRRAAEQADVYAVRLPLRRPLAERVLGPGGLAGRWGQGPSPDRVGPEDHSDLIR